jgi:hypothetical protein
MQLEVLWKPWQEPGLEHLRLNALKNGFEAESVMIGLKDDQPFRLRYRIQLDERWVVREVLIDLLDSKSPGIALYSDGKGHWLTGSNVPIPVLDSCIDIDISVTPFTNTIPIKRLELQPGVATNINVAYIDVPSMEIRPMMQQYTCLIASDQGGLYRYRSLARNFTAELPTDTNGLVIDYPELFTRVWSR